MNKEMIVRAWKNPRYRESLAPEQREALPDNPSGKALSELGETELDIATGGRPLNTSPPICATWFLWRCRDLCD
ncbi:mersacidin/lichenicidin family type 2 lantibiotic [Archangium gephyra]|uniref:mersacidin/lichenicidin family type 2 lantibiotic n=1 Tax=Archangium gephyra TaxID=48 RepID=UPI0035D50B61